MKPFHKELKRLLEPLEKGSRFEIHDVQTIPVPCSKLTGKSTGDFKQTRRLILITAQSLDNPKAIVCGMEAIEYREYHADGHIDSTVYISKVDTTGYPLIKNITGIMVQAYLVSLGPCKVYVFACAQPQYLFRDSAKYSGKKAKTLSDRALIGWWRNILSHPDLWIIDSHDRSENGSDQGLIKRTKGWWSIPGIDDERQAIHTTGNRLKNVPGIEWKYGYPYDPKADFKDVIPLFEDDTKARLSKALRSSSAGDDVDDTMNVEGFWEILGHTEECGAGRLTGFLMLDLSNRPQPSIKDTYEGMVLRSKFTRIWNTMMDLFFDTKEHIEESTKDLESAILEYSPGIKPFEVHTLGDPVEKPINGHEEQTQSVNILGPGLTKRKAEGASTVNVLGGSLIKRKPTAPSPNVLGANLIKRKPTESTATVNDLGTNSIKRPRTVEES
ncbi:histone acetylation protein-domain-containing protein [Phycomyces nitens]|nr:histone acetylation protein-domain-containing protein [Phycomyces nitens]